MMKLIYLWAFDTFPFSPVFGGNWLAMIVHVYTLLHQYIILVRILYNHAT